MEIDVDERTLRVVILGMNGRLDAFTAPSLREQADQLITESVRHIVCDLSRVAFMDSAGLAVLVSLMKRCRQAGGDVRLVWPAAEAAQRILQLTKFDRVFERFDDRDLAVNSFLG
jgi:anti-anti-sigma factor